MVPADDNVCPYTTFSSLLNLVSLIESVLDPNRTRCFVVSDLGTNYLQSILSNGDGIISVLLCGHLYLTQREFVHLCEKAQRGTFICAHAWIFFKLCILITHYIRTMKMYLSN